MKWRAVLAKGLRGAKCACFRSRFDVASSAGFTLFLRITNHAATAVARFWNSATSSSNQTTVLPFGSSLIGFGKIPFAIFSYRVEFDQPVAARTAGLRKTFRVMRGNSNIVGSDRIGSDVSELWSIGDRCGIPIDKFLIGTPTNSKITYWQVAIPHTSCEQSPR